MSDLHDNGYNMSNGKAYLYINNFITLNLVILIINYLVFQSEENLAYK